AAPGPASHPPPLPRVPAGLVLLLVLLVLVGRPEAVGRPLVSPLGLALDQKVVVVIEQLAPQGLLIAHSLDDGVRQIADGDEVLASLHSQELEEATVDGSDEDVVGEVG